MPNREVAQRTFTLRQVAAYLGVSPWRVRRAIARRELKAFRWRKLYMLDREDLDGFIEELKRGSVG